MDDAGQAYYLSPSLLERLMKKVRMGYKGTAALLFFVMGGLLVGALGLDGLLTPPKTSQGKPQSLSTAAVYTLQMPFMITYIFLMFSYLRKWLNRVLLTMRSLTPMDEDAFRALIQQEHKRNRRTQWITTSIYVSLSYLVLSGWSDKYPATSAYWLISVGVISVFIGQMIATIPLLGRRLLHVTLQHATRYNLFHPGPLRVVSDWSVRVTFVFMGAIVLGELFVPANEVMSPTHLIVNGCLILVALGLHFFMIWGTHRFMLAQKAAEMGRIRTQILAHYDELQAKLQGRQPVESEFGSAVNALFAYEDRLKRLPHWPQNPAIINRLIFTLIMPMGIGLIKKLFFKFIFSK